MKGPKDAPGDNVVPVADGRKNRFSVPLIIIEYQVGKDLLDAANKKGDVLINVDFDAVGSDNLARSCRKA